MAKRNDLDQGKNLSTERLFRDPAPGELVMGELTERYGNGLVQVRFEIMGRVFDLAAQALAPVPEDRSARVVLAFIGGDWQAPIVLGALCSPLDAAVASTAQDDGVLKLRADRGVELGCGQASIKLSPDGQVLIEGRNIVSRAETGNRMIGAHIGLN